MWLLACTRWLRNSGLAAGGPGRGARAARRHHPERHHQGVPVPGDVRVPAGSVPAPDQRHDRVHRRDMPRWNPINVCSYHLQEAGATPVQELAYALVHGHRGAGRGPRQRPGPPRRPSGCRQRCLFFVNAGVRFVEEMCKMRAFGRLWAHLVAERYGVTDPTRAPGSGKAGRWNSLGLTQPQPENNVQPDRARAAGLTCRGTPGPGPGSCRPGTRRSGLPRPWDQQWSLRVQQVLAYESDLLEYDDLFEGSRWWRPPPPSSAQRPGRRDRPRPRAMGGVVAAGQRLPQVRPGHRARAAAGPGRVRGGHRGRAERVHRHRAQPAAGRAAARCRPCTRAVEAHAVDGLATGGGRPADPTGARQAARRGCGRRPRATDNLVPATLACAAGRGNHRGVGRGAARGVRRVPGAHRGVRCRGAAPSPQARDRADGGGASTADELDAPSDAGRKPGLDGHSNGAEQVAVACPRRRLRVVYRGIRLTPNRSWPPRSRGRHVVGLSVLSGSHLAVVPRGARPGCVTPGPATWSWSSAGSSPTPTPRCCVAGRRPGFTPARLRPVGGDDRHRRRGPVRPRPHPTGQVRRDPKPVSRRRRRAGSRGRQPGQRCVSPSLPPECVRHSATAITAHAIRRGRVAISRFAAGSWPWNGGRQETERMPSHSHFSGNSDANCCIQWGRFLKMKNTPE